MHQYQVGVTLPGATHLVYDLSRSRLGFRHIHKLWRLLGFEQAKSSHIDSPMTPFSFKYSALWPSVSVSPSDKASEGPHFTPHSVPGLVPIKYREPSEFCESVLDPATAVGRRIVLPSVRRHPLDGGAGDVFWNQAGRGTAGRRFGMQTFRSRPRKRRLRKDHCRSDKEAHLSDTRTARATILRSGGDAAFSISRSDFIIASIDRHRRHCEKKPIAHSIRRMAPLH
jgi:hypothetical protein